MTNIASAYRRKAGIGDRILEIVLRSFRKFLDADDDGMQRATRLRRHVYRDGSSRAIVLHAVIDIKRNSPQGVSSASELQRVAARDGRATEG